MSQTLSDSSHPITNIPKFKGWRTIFHNIKEYWFFVMQLSRISIVAGYKRSFIGLLWLFIMPVLSVIVWILLHSAGIINPGTTDIPYPAYVLLSTSIWGFFIEIYRKTSLIISGNGKIMIMNNFPHEILLAHTVLVHLFNFIIPFAINVIVLLAFGVKLSWWSFLFPLTLIPLLLLGSAIGLFVSLLRVVAVDICVIIDEGMRFLMFLTPIVYAPKIKLSWLGDIIMYNPLTYLIGFSRDMLTSGKFYEPVIYMICCFFCLLAFILAVRIYMIAQPKTLERLINI